MHVPPELRFRLPLEAKQEPCARKVWHCVVDPYSSRDLCVETVHNVHFSKAERKGASCVELV